MIASRARDARQSGGSRHSHRCHRWRAPPANSGRLLSDTAMAPPRRVGMERDRAGRRRPGGVTTCRSRSRPPTASARCASTGWQAPRMFPTGGHTDPFRGRRRHGRVHDHLHGCRADHEPVLRERVERVPEHDRHDGHAGAHRHKEQGNFCDWFRPAPAVRAPAGPSAGAATLPRRRCSGRGAATTSASQGRTRRASGRQPLSRRS